MADFTQNRELSWLRFNDRVLSEATDEGVPLLERLKFISIFTGNLDEFFMIRVGSLFDLMNLDDGSVDNKTGWTPAGQLERIYAAVGPLYQKREKIYFDLERRLGVFGVRRRRYEELEGADRAFVRDYFKNAMAPILSPQIVDAHHPFPHLQNKVLHVGAWVRYRDDREDLALIPVPTSLPPALYLPGPGVSYVLMEDILSAELDAVFPNYTVLERVIFCVTRNADVNPDDESDEFDDDFRMKMKKVLGRRRRLAPVRLELSGPIGPAFSASLLGRLPVTRDQVFQTAAPLKADYVFSLAAKLDGDTRARLTYPPLHPRLPRELAPKKPMLAQVLARDVLLCYPYESMSPFLRLLREAAEDEAVVSIKITIYRLARKAKLVEYLCEAAENGKDVTVLIELRARFDEQNNIDWSEQLEQAGCNVIYGFEGYKVHSKICLITRREKGEIQYITQVGTGNYNEKTAELYTDVSLMTADEAIGRDANDFFRNMAIGNLEGIYHELLVAPVSLKQTLLGQIDAEIAKGARGKILCKLNSITDLELIEKLREASCAGVQIDLIVRGICCLLPGVPGETENIRVRSIVGRFLEHSRLYCFGSGGQERMYLASADLMTRNTQRRVEVACPVHDRHALEKLHAILAACLADNTKARLLQSDGSYLAPPPAAAPVDCQQLLLTAPDPGSSPAPKSPLSRFRRHFQK